MGAQLSAPSNLSNIAPQCDTEGFKVGPQLGSIMSTSASISKLLPQSKVCRVSSIGIQGSVHTENLFPNLIESKRIRIVFTMHRLISNQTDVRVVPNQSENGKYNLFSV